MTDLDANSLRDRIWNTFPVAQPAFAKLLALLEIEVSRDVPTAAVSLGARSWLRINPDFAALRCGSDQALVMLVLHELFHVVLGHTRLYERATPTLNFAFDAVINAQLCLLHPGPEWTRLFRDCYGALDRPWCLLRPPDGWRTPAEHWLPGELGALHRRLYTDEATSYEDLFRLLAQACEGHGLGEALAGGSGTGKELAGRSGTGEALTADLLGSHDGPQTEPLDPELVAEIREILATWPMVTERSGRDQGGPARAFRLDLGDRRRQAAATLRRALRGLGDHPGDGSGRPRLTRDPAAMSLPHRTGGDRRAAVLEACGMEPVFFAGTSPQPAWVRGERIHVYLDVSGSMDGVIAPLYCALAHLTDRLTPRIHLFSTRVHDITQEELRRGQGGTTGGTDIAVVTGHLVAQGIRRALIVTDGWVGAVPSEHASTLARRRGRFAVALTQGGDPAFAAALGARVWNLPSVNQEQP